MFMVVCVLLIGVGYLEFEFDEIVSVVMIWFGQFFVLIVFQIGFI